MSIYPIVEYYVAYHCKTEEILDKDKDLLKLVERLDKKYTRDDFIVGYEFKDEVGL